MEKILNSIIQWLLFFIIFLFPLFFLPFTQDFFITNKLYLLAFGALFLFLISNIQYLVSKKIFWCSLPLDTPIILFPLTIGLSILISSPNKIQALLSPHFGLVLILSLTVLYFYLSRLPSSANQLLTYSLTFSSLLVALLTIIFFFQPFKNVNLPTNLQILKNPSFTPLGNQVDLAIFLGFFVVLGLSRILGRIKPNQQSNNETIQQSIIGYSLFIINLIALSITLYSLFQPVSTNSNQFQPVLTNLPPFRLSWFAAVEVLKNPLTALFGVGVDNFSSIFTKVKDLNYNQSNLWQINSSNLSSSTFLHIFTETGIFGIIAFILNLFQMAKTLFIKLKNHQDVRFLFFYLLLILMLFPPSLTIFFLFFLIISQIANIQYQISTQNISAIEGGGSNIENKSVDLSQFLPVYLGMAIFSFFLIGTASYLLSRTYAAEFFFKKSLDGFTKNDAKQVYDNMRQAIILNPYNERFRLNFSQVNLIIANNIALKKQEEITEQDRQNISQAIQAAINEAKAAVTLNPQKASNWENLAVIYRNILNVAQGADVWSISAYQRAIVADPQNPIYRLNLGGLYYSLGNYEEAVKLFEQAVALKPDWANAYYNLAWALYQKKDYQRATSQMQIVSQLVDPKSEDAQKVKKDLEEFKKIMANEEATPTGELKPGKLNLPTPPPTTIEPKISLPKEASPEAK